MHIPLWMAGVALVPLMGASPASTLQSVTAPPPQVKTKESIVSKPTPTTSLQQAVLPLLDPLVDIVPNRYLLYFNGGSLLKTVEQLMQHVFTSKDCTLSNPTALDVFNSVYVTAVGKCTLPVGNKVIVYHSTYMDHAVQDDKVVTLNKREFKDLFPRVLTGIDEKLVKETGKGVNIAVVDEGFDVKLDAFKSINLGGTLTRFDKINELSKNPDDLYADQRGHGTMVLGILAALPGTYDYRGIAPGATYYLGAMKNTAPLRKVDENALSLFEDLLKQDKMDILTASLLMHNHYLIGPMYKFAQTLEKNNILFTKSAGNKGKKGLLNRDGMVRLSTPISVGTVLVPDKYTFTMAIQLDKEKTKRNEYYCARKFFPGSYTLYPNYAAFSKNKNKHKDLITKQFYCPKDKELVFILVTCKDYSTVFSNTKDSPCVVLVVPDCNKNGVTAIKRKDSVRIIAFKAADKEVASLVKKEATIHFYQDDHNKEKPLTNSKDELKIEEKIEQNHPGKLEIAESSSFGPGNDFSIKPSLVAPGSDMNLLLNAGLVTQDTGTSFATPYVAGVLALLIQHWREHHPKCEYQAKLVRNALFLSANPFLTTYTPSNHPNDIPSAFQQGSGLVDVGKAIQLINLHCDKPTSSPLHWDPQWNLPPCKLPADKEFSAKKLEMDCAFKHDGFGKLADWKMKVIPAMTLGKKRKDRDVMYLDSSQILRPSNNPTVNMLELDATSLVEHNKEYGLEFAPLLFYSGYIQLTATQPTNKNQPPLTVSIPYGGVFYAQDYVLNIAEGGHTTTNLIMGKTHTIEVLACKPYTRMVLYLVEKDEQGFKVLGELVNLLNPSYLVDTKQSLTQYGNVHKIRWNGEYKPVTTVMEWNEKLGDQPLPVKSEFKKLAVSDQLRTIGALFINADDKHEWVHFQDTGFMLTKEICKKEEGGNGCAIF